MTYTGDVRPGGPSDVRVLDEVEVRKASVGQMDNNAYLVTCRHTGAQLLVDAAAEPERLLELVREGAATARLDGIATTHSIPTPCRRSPPSSPGPEHRSSPARRTRTPSQRPRTVRSVVACTTATPSRSGTPCWR